MNRDYKAEIRKEAKEWEALREQVYATFKLRDRSAEDLAEWSEACKAWHGYSRPVLDTFESTAAMEQLATGDPELLELAICFVEVNPYYFRSGYLKKRLFRRLRGMALSEKARQRIQQGILHAVLSHEGAGWKDFCSLATAFFDANFEHSVTRYVSDEDQQVSRRAKSILAHIRQQRTQATNDR